MANETTPIMGSGLRLLDAEFGTPKPIDRLWTVTDVSYGHTTDWRLRISLEDGEHEILVWFEDPTCFRVLDERDLMDYWTQRAVENVNIGTLYSVSRSLFLQEMDRGISVEMLRAGEAMTHYLVAGTDNCVEVISSEPPSFERTGG